MNKLTLSSKNQVVIPKAVRTKMGLASGDRLIIERLTGKEMILRKEPSYHDLIGTIPTQKEDPVVRIRKLRDAWKK